MFISLISLFIYSISHLAYFSLNPQLNIVKIRVCISYKHLGHTYVSIHLIALIVCLMLYNRSYPAKFISLIICSRYKANHLLLHRLIPQSNLVSSLISTLYELQNRHQDSIQLIASIAAYPSRITSLAHLTVHAINFIFIFVHNELHT